MFPRLEKYPFSLPAIFPNSIKLSQNSLQLFDATLLFLARAPPHTKAGDMRHPLVDGGASGLDFAIAKCIFQELVGLGFAQVFLLDDLAQGCLPFGSHKGVPFQQNILHVVDACQENFDRPLLLRSSGLASTAQRMMISTALPSQWKASRAEIQDS